MTNSQKATPQPAFESGRSHRMALNCNQLYKAHSARGRGQSITRNSKSQNKA